MNIQIIQLTYLNEFGQPVPYREEDWLDEILDKEEVQQLPLMEVEYYEKTI